MKENILSITIGAVISLMMTITGREIANGLLFSFIGGFMGLIGNTICKYFIQKIERMFKSWFIRFKRYNRKNK